MYGVFNPGRKVRTHQMNSFARPVGQAAKNNRPAFNTIQTNNSWIVHVALPGYEKGDVEILSKENELILKTKESVKSEKNTHETFLRKEFSMEAFEMSLQLPNDAVAEDIKATFKSGILMLEIPKRQPKKVEIKG